MEKNLAGDQRWTDRGDAVLVNVETTHLIETFSQLDDKTDVQSEMTDGQSLRPVSQGSMEEMAETFRTSR